ncbi:MAG: geranylgeranylglycerol-phosphate geranylgeranyltransferase [Sulfolobales archaeon]
MNPSKTLISVIKLSRPHNVFITFLGVLVGAAVIDPNATRDLYTVLLISIPALAVAAGGYIVNDYYDIEIDRRSKPWRPLVRGDITPRAAFTISIALFALGVLISFPLLGIFVGLFVAANTLLTYLYSWRLKRLGLVGNIAVSMLSANSILYGSISYASVQSNIDPKSLGLALIPWLFAFIMSLSREIVKGIEDISGDREQGVRTLAVTRGYVYASLITIALLVFLLAIVALPLIYRWSVGYLALSITSIIIFLASVASIPVSRDMGIAVKRASISRSVSKASLLLGTLAFLVWAIS